MEGKIVLDLDEKSSVNMAEDSDDESIVDIETKANVVGSMVHQRVPGWRRSV